MARELQPTVVMTGRVWHHPHQVVQTDASRLSRPPPQRDSASRLGFPNAVHDGHLPRSSPSPGQSIFAARRRLQTTAAPSPVPQERPVGDDAQDMFDRMSEAERLEARESLLQTLPPDLIEKWMSHDREPEASSSSSSSSDDERVEVDDTDVVPSSDPDNGLPGDESPGDWRFDFQGRIVSAKGTGHVDDGEGLHHHDAEPSRPGYTIGELCRLARSAVTAQRTAALAVMTAVLTSCRRAAYGDRTVPIWRSMHFANKAPLLLRSSLDSTNAKEMHLALSALAVTFAPGVLDVTVGDLDRYQGGVVWPGHAPEASADILKPLLSMSILERLRYIVDAGALRPDIVSDDAFNADCRRQALLLLTAIAAHSPEFARRIVACDMMLPALLDALRADATVEDTLTLLRLLCLASPDASVAVSACTTIRSIIEGDSRQRRRRLAVRVASSCMRHGSGLIGDDADLVLLPPTGPDDARAYCALLSHATTLARVPLDAVRGWAGDHSSQALSAVLHLLACHPYLAVSPGDLRDVWRATCDRFVDFRPETHQVALPGVFQPVQRCSDVADTLCSIVRYWDARSVPCTSDVVDDLVGLLAGDLTGRCACTAALVAHAAIYLSHAAIGVSSSSLPPGGFVRFLTTVPSIAFPGQERLCARAVKSLVAAALGTATDPDLLELMHQCIAGCDATLPLSPAWLFDTTVSCLDLSTIDTQRSIRMTRALLRFWALDQVVGSVSSQTLWQALLRVFCLGCQVFLDATVDKHLDLLTRRCLASGQIGNVDKSVVDHVGAVFVEESFGSDVFSRVILCMLVGGALANEEAQVALWARVGVQTACRLGAAWSDGDVMPPMTMQAYLPRTPVSHDVLVYLQDVLKQPRVSSWIMYASAVHATHLAYFRDDLDDASVAVMDLADLVISLPRQPLLDLLSYDPSAPCHGFFCLRPRDSVQFVRPRVRRVLDLAVQFSPDVADVVSTLPSDSQ